ncbi:MAG TPA: pitrilysin family protein [Burkholderiaceae bacterium]|nr:pitrilysin family protein [Burkholderiaceae bacterium]
MRFVKALVAGLWVVQAGLASAALPKPVTEVEGIGEYRLANGLQVLLAPDDSKPTTTVNVTYRVGSRQENYGETGMAHLLEHLIFKGTPTHHNVWAEFSKRGLRANGSTWVDRTNYFASFSANDDNLRWYLGWQADAMVNSFIARKDLDTEMTVVRNEMEMGENDPGRILFEKTLAAMFQWHNYGKSTIGARSDVENVDIGRLQAFYRLYYQPDNATLIVSGKFDRARTMAWIEQSFGRIPKPKRALPRLYTVDPVQDGERSVTLRRVGGVPQVMLGYHAPPGPHPDYPAMELISLIVGDSPSGRAHKRLVETGLASGVFAESLAMADPGVALFGAQFAAGQDPSRGAQELIQVVEGLAAEPITDEEFKRAQTKWLKSWEQQYSNPETIGLVLSETVAQGDWRLLFLDRDRVRALTRDAVQQVAQQRLVTSNRTLATYVPTDKPVRAPQPEEVDVAAQMKTFKPQASGAAVAAFDSSPANIDIKTQRLALPNGMKVALLPKPTRGQTVRISMAMRVGNERSLTGLREVSEFTAAMIDKGGAGLTRVQIQDRLDALKSELQVASSGDEVRVTLRSQRDTVADTIKLLAHLLRSPSFPAAALDELKRQTAAEIQGQRDDPQAIVANGLARRGDPYPRGDVRHARSFDERLEDSQAVTLERIKDFHARFYGASQARFAAVGDFDAEAVRQALTAGFGDWVASEPASRVARPVYAMQPGREVINTPDKQNATLGIELHLPLSDSDAVHPALMLANFMLGGGGDSRLFKRIREREGLSYDVYSALDWGDLDAHTLWFGGAIFAPSNRDKVEQAYRDELAKAVQEGFSEQEVASAKAALLNYRRLARAQDDRLAQALQRNLDLDRTFAFAGRVDTALAALQAGPVSQALRAQIKPEQMAFMLAGDFKQP